MPHDLCHAFYRAANAIFGKLATAESDEVLLQIIFSECYPVLLYTLEACDLKEDQFISPPNVFFMRSFLTVKLGNYYLL